MTEVFGNLALGMGVALSLQNLFFCFIGALVGTMIGVLPGIGPVATVAMLLPITFYLDPVPALIMLAGIYYGAQYGGSTTAILVALPGESSSVVTVLDGHQMAKQGRAGSALAIAALGSFFAGCFATVVIALFSPPLSLVAQQFGPADYFSLMVFGLVAAIVLAHGAPLKAVAMVLLGLLLGLVGTDVNSGALRFTFSLPELSDGIGFVPLAMGLFGIAEIIANLERTGIRGVAARIERLWPTRADFRQSWPAILRGTSIGSLLGVLPGGGALLSSFAAYTVEKKIAKDPARFGRGAIEGVAAPESANNAGAQTSFIPMLTLGIPPNPVMALMIGAMAIHGIVPGPLVMQKQPELFWGMIASMWLGNLMLIVINLPLIGIWVKFLQIPYRWLYSIILIFCCIGVYTVNNTTTDVLIMALFGLFGYFLTKIKCEPAPLILGFILGPMLEENFRRSLIISRGSWWVFLERPICLGFLVLSLIFLLVVLLPGIRKGREVAFKEG
jgi:TctA family transporter